MSAALPLAEQSPAELAISKLRAMFAPRRIDVRELWWNLLNTDDRRFVCRLAKVDPDLSTASWRALELDQREALFGAWNRLREWIDRVQRHLVRVQR